VATSLVVESLPLTSPTPKLHQPTSGSGHHHAWLLHLAVGLGYLLRTPRPAPPTRVDLICSKVHELRPMLPPPPSPRSLAPWMPPPTRVDPICLEVHELPSSPQQKQVFLKQDMMSTSGCPLVVTMGGWFAWDPG
jgi:hypothetical protein